MTGWNNLGEATLTSVVEEVFHAHKGMPGFQGADIGFRWRPGSRRREMCLRLHVSGPQGEMAARIPSEFAGVPIEVVCAEYTAEPLTAEGNRAAPFLTSGSSCSAANGGGQVTLMVVDRVTGRLKFLSSWAAAAGKGARIGAPVYERPNPPKGERPIGYLESMRLDRNGSAALCDPHPDRAWLPIVRPSNQTITALKMPRLGERLRAGSGYGQIDGVGIYRVRHEVARGRWRSIDIEGVRFASRSVRASGALVYDDQTATGAGLVCAHDRQAPGRTYSVACALPKVFAHLGLRLAGYDDLVRAPFAPARVEVGADADRRFGDPRDALGAASPRQHCGSEASSNHRPDIATVLWPGLREALKAEVGRDFRITERVERLDPAGRAPSRISRAVNRSVTLADLGLPKTRPEDFAGAATFDQVCERLADLLETVA